MKECLMNATSENLKARGHDDTSLGEFLGNLGYLFVVKVRLGRHPRDFFSINPRDKFWNLSHVKDAMNGKMFERINEFINSYDEEKDPEYRDRLFWTRNMTKGFNDSMSTKFNPSWLAFVDKIMVDFSNAHAP